MRSLYQPDFSATAQEKQRLKTQAEEIQRLRGTNRTPDPPRDVTAQSGSRKVLLSWKLPVSADDIVAWRVYKGDEDTLYETIKDRGQRLLEIASSAATTSPVQNFFVSSLNALGLESVKVQCQGSALAETGAPVDPTPPPGYTTEASGGADRTSGGTGGGRGNLT